MMSHCAPSASRLLTASAKVIRETSTEAPGNLAGGLAALRGLGIYVGGSSIGLTAETYPDILRSREVRLAVARSMFYFDDLDTTMNLVDYHNRPPGVLGFLLAGLKSSTVELPRKLIRKSHGNDTAPVVLVGKGLGDYPTKAEEKTTAL